MSLVTGASSKHPGLREEGCHLADTANVLEKDSKKVGSAGEAIDQAHLSYPALKNNLLS